MTIATKSVPRSRYEELNLDRFPSAGPRPNITGMKKRHWGEGAYCIKCGQYVYHVDRETWERA